MALTNEQIASAISRHSFEDAIPYLSDDISWTLVGAEPLVGKQAVLAACEGTAAELSGVTTEFRRFRTIVTATSVVIDSLADYIDVDSGSRSTVGSCDIYDFEDGMMTSITSYNIEIPE